MKTLLTLTLMAGGISTAAAQAIPAPASPSDNPSNNPTGPSFPQVKLTYYVGEEGDRGEGYKQVRRFDLDEWTPGTSVRITAHWESYPDYNAPYVRRSHRGHVISGYSYRMRRQLNWQVTYLTPEQTNEAAAQQEEKAEPAESEIGPPQLLVGGPGFADIVLPITHAGESFVLLHIATSGWHRLGASPPPQQPQTAPAAPVAPETPSTKTASVAQIGSGAF